MAISKNPSIYDDRSSIGSSEELDEYGVWVKVSPEDFVETRKADDVDLEELSVDLEEQSLEVSELLDYSDDDLETLGEEMQIPEEEDEEEDEGLPASDLSTQLLMKIADELASIKGELSDLKSELSVIRSEKPVGNANEKGDDFFDEDNDDKIALTGDELNNILHTADFTEETGADAGENLGDDFEDILDTPDALADFEAKDTEDLKALRENGVEPMTAAPPDTSYLDEDPLVEEPIDLMAEPFPDTVPQDESLFEEVSFDELAGGGESIDLSTIEAVEPLEGEQNIDFDFPPLDLPAEEEEDTEDTADLEDLNIDLGLLSDISLDDLPVDIPEEAPAKDDTEDTSNIEDLNIDLGSLPDISLDDLPVDIPEEAPSKPEAGTEIPSGFRNELIQVLEYMDKLLESLPEEKIEEFAQSEHYVTYKKLFDELGIE
ncbi:hypothetical protein AGMMS49942_09430 [Spirochaetia bacterium]|nr:hypothetical protein AGMMS49942_09430 [Spirochaetia bacterium]